MSLNAIISGVCLYKWGLPVDIIWTDLKNVSNHKDVIRLQGSGFWTDYFEPLVPEFNLGMGCELPVVMFSVPMAMPGLHLCAEWAARGWYYGDQAHLPGDKTAYDETWFRRSRMSATKQCPGCLLYTSDAADE